MHQPVPASKPRRGPGDAPHEGESVPGTERDAVSTRRGVFRVGMLAVALPQAAVSIWALVAPRSFYRDFPGAGRHWLPPLGSFNEHLVNDYGAFTLGLAIAL